MNQLTLQFNEACKEFGWDEQPSDYWILQIASFISDPLKALFANEQGFLAAAITNEYMFLPNEPVALEVAWWVKPESRGTEVGRALYKEFEQWAKDNGCNRILQGIKTKNAKKIGEIYLRDL